MDKRENRPFQRIGFWLGGLAILGCIALGIKVSATIFLQPAPYTRIPFDNKLAITYALALLLVGVIFWIARGRFLWVVTIMVASALLMIAAFATGLGIAFLILLWWLFASVIAGDWLLSRFGVQDQLALAERLCFDAALGFGGFMILSLILGLLHLYYVPIAYGLLILVTIIFLPYFLAHLWPKLNTKTRWIYRNLHSTDLHWQGLAAAILLIMIAGSFLWALAPTVRYDALTYHVAAPAIYINNHAIVPIPEGQTTTWAHYAEMLYAFGMLLYGQPLPGMLHLLFGCLSTLLTFTLARRLINPRVGWIAAILFFSTPLVSYETGTAYIDFFVALYCLAMVVCGVCWMQQNRRSWLVLSGVFAGIAVGIKLTAAPIVLPFCLALLVWGFLQSRSIKSVSIAFYFGLPVLMISLPWLVRDWIWTGDPIFPFGSNLLARLLPVSATAANAIGPASLKPGQLLRMLLFLWDLVVHSAWYYHESPGAMLGALPLLALPWLYLGYRGFPTKIRSILATLFALILASALILFKTSGGLARYLSSLYPLMAICAAANFEVLWRGLQSSRISKTTQVLVQVLALGLALAYLFSTRLAVTVRTMSSNERYPISFFLGREGREQFLAGNLPIYPVFKYLDQEGGGHHSVLSIGNEFRLYTNSTIYGIWDAPDAYGVMANSKNAEDLAQQIAQKGYDYLLINEPEKAFRPEKYEFDVLSRDFLNRYAQLVFVNQGIYLYRLYPQGAPPVSESNLLQNSSFENLNSSGYPLGWNWDGKIQVDGADHAHTGAFGVKLHGPVPQAEYGYIYQDVPVDGKQIYTAGYWLNSDVPVTIQLQVNWLDQASQLISSSMEWKTSQPGWTWYQMSAISPANARYGRVFASINGQEVAWFDDLCFVQGQKCP